ncbi:APC family permease (plasmid) [Deinococcus taeanensis]|uniref:APC family permease n=1 Tax=Deinococcus taeanensis TaxID=2737050 RepID=UPI001CDB86D5|nr:APC family permease [Deinococcus taeanensis]UBV44685.1 APC family permease [Deinococcus taeanensis]
MSGPHVSPVTPDDAGVEAFGYTQELKRALSFRDLLIYGMIFMVPIAPFGIFGYVMDASKGMVALAYLVGMIAMFFTAMSYRAMSRDFPVSGSVYAYAQRGINQTAGFFAGWLILLDYILIPALLYVVSAAALAPLFPAVPKAAWILGFIAIGAVINLRGVELTARANRVFLVLELAVLVTFLVVGLSALYGGAGAGGLTLAPLYQPGVVTPAIIGAAVSVCALSFLGFDAISTLSEEVQSRNRNSVGRATLAALFLMGGIFILQTWVAADLSKGLSFKTLDTAFYEAASVAGGQWLYQVTAWATAIAWGVANSLVSQAAISRILYAMARDRQLPAPLARVHPTFKTPYVSILVVVAISIVVALGFMNNVGTLTSFVNFGALTGFLFLHFSVMYHFLVRQRSRDYLNHLVFPGLGFAIIAYVLYTMGTATWVLGLSWLAIGVVYYLVLTLVLQRQTTLEV